MIQNVDIENLCELEKNNNNECKIKRVKKTEKLNLKNIIIPNYITSIDDYAFNNCFNLESIEIPSSVTSIGINAFINCTNLKNIYYSGTIEDWCNIKFYNSFSNPMYNKNRFFMKDNNGKYQEVTEIVIPNSVKKIKEYQFFGFNNIKVIKIQNGVETIGPHAFAYCQSLENVLIPDSVTNIELYAFWYCTSLISAKIPNSVKKIGLYAFCGCTSLKSIRIPKDVVQLEQSFYICNNLENIIVDENNTIFDSRNNCNAIIRTKDNCLILGCKNTIIPNNITKIGDAAFSYCNDLENIVIPSGVINIEDSAFSNCKNLKSILIPNSVVKIGASAFSNCKSLEKIIIPDSIIKIGDLAFSYCSSLVNISVDENNKNYKSINGNLYSYDGKKLIQYAIGKKDDLFITPNNLEVIGSSAFDSCNYLKNVIISNNVNRICSYAFFNCESLESVIIPKNILYINKCAFKDCDALTIYCEAESKPDTWSKKWNESNCNVIWNYTTNI